MLKKQVSKVLKNQLENTKKNELHIELFKEEKDYVEKFNLIPDEVKEKVTLIEKNSGERFIEAYIERSDKESEQLISTEGVSFLKQPLDLLKKHKNEFVYVESENLDLIGVDAIAIEVDDVFGTYDVMIGLKLQKKLQKQIKDQLNQTLNGEGPTFDLMFSQEDGLWNLNFALNDVQGYREDLLMGEAFNLIYQ